MRLSYHLKDFLALFDQITNTCLGTFRNFRRKITHFGIQAKLMHCFGGILKFLHCQFEPLVLEQLAATCFFFSKNEKNLRKLSQDN